MSDSNCLTLGVTSPWATALHIAVLKTPPLFLSVCIYIVLPSSLKLSPSHVFLFCYSAVPQYEQRFRVWFPVYINPEIKNVLWILLDQTIMLWIYALLLAGPFSTAYFPHVGVLIGDLIGLSLFLKPWRYTLLLHVDLNILTRIQLDLLAKIRPFSPIYLKIDMRKRSCNTDLFYVKCMTSRIYPWNHRASELCWC